MTKMIVFTILLLTFIKATAVVDGEKTTGCQEKDGVLPNPDVTDCSSYVVCKNGSFQEFQCSEGLLYNPFKRTCDYNTSISCEDGEAVQTVETRISTPSTDVECETDTCTCVYPSQYSCSEYYRCENGVAYKEQCPPGLALNVKKLTCDYEENVDCSITTSVPQNSETTRVIAVLSSVQSEPENNGTDASFLEETTDANADVTDQTVSSTTEPFEESTFISTTEFLSLLTRTTTEFSSPFASETPTYEESFSSRLPVEGSTSEDSSIFYTDNPTVSDGSVEKEKESHTTLSTPEESVFTESSLLNTINPGTTVSENVLNTHTSTPTTEETTESNSDQIPNKSTLFSSDAISELIKTTNSLPSTSSSISEIVKDKTSTVNFEDSEQTMPEASGENSIDTKTQSSITTSTINSTFEDKETTTVNNLLSEESSHTSTEVSKILNETNSESILITPTTMNPIKSSTNSLVSEVLEVTSSTRNTFDKPLNTISDEIGDITSVEQTTLDNTNSFLTNEFDTSSLTERLSTFSQSTASKPQSSTNIPVAIGEISETQETSVTLTTKTSYETSDFSAFNDTSISENIVIQGSSSGETLNYISTTKDSVLATSILDQSTSASTFSDEPLNSVVTSSSKVSDLTSGFSEQTMITTETSNHETTLTGTQENTVSVSSPEVLFTSSNSWSSESGLPNISENPETTVTPDTSIISEDTVTSENSLSFNSIVFTSSSLHSETASTLENSSVTFEKQDEIISTEKTSIDVQTFSSSIASTQSTAFEVTSTMSNISSSVTINGINFTKTSSEAAFPVSTDYIEPESPVNAIFEETTTIRPTLNIDFSSTKLEVMEDSTGTSTNNSIAFSTVIDSETPIISSSASALLISSTSDSPVSLSKFTSEELTTVNIDITEVSNTSSSLSSASDILKTTLSNSPIDNSTYIDQVTTTVATDINSALITSETIANVSSDEGTTIVNIFSETPFITTSNVSDISSNIIVDDTNSSQNIVHEVTSTDITSDESTDQFSSDISKSLSTAFNDLNSIKTALDDVTTPITGTDSSIVQHSTVTKLNTLESTVSSGTEVSELINSEESIEFLGTVDTSLKPSNMTIPVTTNQKTSSTDKDAFEEIFSEVPTTSTTQSKHNDSLIMNDITTHQTNIYSGYTSSDSVPPYDNESTTTNGSISTNSKEIASVTYSVETTTFPNIFNSDKPTDLSTVKEVNTSLENSKNPSTVYLTSEYSEILLNTSMKQTPSITTEIFTDVAFTSTTQSDNLNFDEISLDERDPSSSDTIMISEDLDTDDSSQVSKGVSLSDITAPTDISFSDALSNTSGISNALMTSTHRRTSDNFVTSSHGILSEEISTPGDAGSLDNLTTSGDAVSSEALTTSGDAVSSEALTTSGDAVSSEALTTSGDAVSSEALTTSGDAVSSEALTTSGDAVSSEALTTSGDAVSSEALTTSGDAVSSEALTTSGDAVSSEALTTSGDAVSSDALTTSGDAVSSDALTTSGDAVSSDALTTSGDAVSSDALTTSGDAVSSDALTTSGDAVSSDALTTSGDAVSSDALTTSGDAVSSDALTTSGDAVSSDALTTSGDAVSSDALTTSGDAVSSDALTTSGDAVSSDALTTSGDAVSSDALTTSGDAVSSDALTTSGDAVSSDALTTSGDAVSSDALTTSGDAVSSDALRTSLDSNIMKTDDITADTYTTGSYGISSDGLTMSFDDSTSDELWTFGNIFSDVSTILESSSSNFLTTLDKSNFSDALNFSDIISPYNLTVSSNDSSPNASHIYDDSISVTMTYSGNGISDVSVHSVDGSFSNAHMTTQYSITSDVSTTPGYSSTDITISSSEYNSDASLSSIYSNLDSIGTIDRSSDVPTPANYGSSSDLFQSTAESSFSDTSIFDNYSSTTTMLPNSLISGDGSSIASTEYLEDAASSVSSTSEKTKISEFSESSSVKTSTNENTVSDSTVSLIEISFDDTTLPISTESISRESKSLTGDTPSHSTDTFNFISTPTIPTRNHFMTDKISSDNSTDTSFITILQTVPEYIEASDASSAEPTSDASSAEPTTSDASSAEPTSDASSAEPTSDASSAEPTTSDASSAEPTTSDASSAEPTTSDASSAEPTTSDASSAEPTTSDASSAEPTTSDASSAEPTTSDASSAEPTTSDASSAEPTTSDASSAEPTTSDASSAEPTTSDASSAEPTTSDASSAEPTTSDASSAEPTTSDASSAEPTTSDASSAEPTTSDASSAEPTTSGASSAEPTTSGASSAEPTTSDASSAEPTTSDASSAEPTTSDASSAEPTTSDASSAEPTTSDASSAEPTTSDASSAEPTTSDASSAEPTTSDASSAEPTTSDASSAEPTTSDASSAEPTTSDASSAEPTTSDASSAEPTTSDASSAEPTTSDASSAEPTTSDASSAEPTTSDASSAEPTTSDASSAEPTTSDASSAEPTTSDASSAEPTTSDASSAEPTTSDASSAEPTTSDASSAEPTTSDASTGLPTSDAPTGLPTSDAPTGLPTSDAPTGLPTSDAPTGLPTSDAPTGLPTSDAPTGLPTSDAPTGLPTSDAPTGLPTSDAPTGLPTSDAPTGLPTSDAPTGLPTSDAPTGLPTSDAPTGLPTSDAPTGLPTSDAPTGLPTSDAPTGLPTSDAPTGLPTSDAPTGLPTSDAPTGLPTSDAYLTSGSSTVLENTKYPFSTQSSEDFFIPDISSDRISTLFVSSETSVPTEVTSLVCGCESCKFEDTKDCTRYFECRNGELVSKQCSLGYLFNNLTNECDSADKVSCNFKTGSCSKEDVYFAHTEDCSSYIQCYNGIPYTKSCPVGLHYNPTMRTCDTKLKCGTKPQVPTTQSYDVECDCDNCVMPDSDDCSKYYLCLNSTAYELKCSDGLHFNPDTLICDYNGSVSCANYSPQCLEKNGNFPIPGECSKYYHCVGGVAYVKECEENKHYSISSELCEEPCLAECDSTLDCNITTSAPLATICEEPNGFYPHPTSCQKFYKCEDGHPTLAECIDNEHFSPTDRFCQDPCEAMCDDTIDCPTLITDVENLSTISTSSTIEELTTEHLSTSAEISFTPSGSITPETTILTSTTPVSVFTDFITEQDTSTTFSLVTEIGSTTTQQTSSETSRASKSIKDETSSEETVSLTDAVTQVSRLEYTSVTPRNQSTTSEPDVCAGGAGVHPNPDDCTSLIACVLGKKLQLHCPRGLHFSPITKRCEEPCDAKCDPNYDCYNTEEPESSSLLPAILCPVKDFLPKKGHCSYYYDCTDGVRRKLKCPRGLHFNPTSRVCDFPSRANCGEPAGALYWPDRYKTCPCETCLLPSPERCSDYHLCLNKTAYPMTCSHGLLFDKDKNTCNYGSETPCDTVFTTTNRPTTSTTKKQATSTSTTTSSTTTKEPTMSTRLPTSTTTVTPRRYRCLERNGLFKNPFKCGSFIQCSNWWPYVKACPGSLHFNPETKRCEHACDAKCDTSLPCVATTEPTVTDSTSHPLCSCRNCLLPSEESCTKYIECKHGKPTKRVCRRGQTFESRRETCDWAHRVDCRHSEICLRRNGLFLYRGNCSKFVHCANGIPYVKTCPTNLHFDPEKLRCEWPSEKCKSEDDGKETEDVKGGIAPHLPQWKCPDSYGYFRSEKGCNQYYICIDGTPHPRICPKNLVFNSKIRVCDWPQNTNCHGIQNYPQKRCRVYESDIQCQRNRTNLAHPHCDSFYDCTTGRACRKRCPDGLYYNRNSDNCDEPQNVSCKNSDGSDYSLKLFTEVCRYKRRGRMTDPSDETCFYRCHHSRVIRGCCSKRKIFDESRNRCVWRYYGL